MNDELSHLDEQGRARMVDVAHKPDTARSATARGEVRMRLDTFEKVRAGNLKKGDVLYFSHGFSIVYKEMEQNEAAVQEAERVVLGVWGHWNRCEEAARLYNPHNKTRTYIDTISDDIEKFFRLCFDKYWSTLGSANGNHKIGKSYLYETDTIDRLLEENHCWIDQHDDIRQFKFKVQQIENLEKAD